MAESRTIAIASGKGGTGKTTIATNLVCILAQSGKQVQYLDCDVEEPNGHIFLKPEITSCVDVTVEVPEVDLEKCIACGKCGEICQYSSIVCIKESVLVFEQLCHSCGGCWNICPANTISAKPFKIGNINVGSTGKIEFISGELVIGNVRTPNLIKAVKSHISDDCVTLIDAPPGTTCPTVEAVKNADYVLLVTEPTPFGLNDLKLAIEMVRLLDIPFGVVINRYGMGDYRVEKFCHANKINILLKFPDDRRIAECYSQGYMIADELPEYKQSFMQLAESVDII